MPSPFPPQPDPSTLNVPAIINAHGMAGTVELVPGAAEPLDTFAIYVPYRSYLLTQQRRGRIAVGIAAMTRYCPLAKFLEQAHFFEDVRVYPSQIEIDGTRYQTPEWVRRLIFAEKLYGEGRVMSAPMALRTLDIVLDSMESAEQDATATAADEEARDGDAVAG